MIDSGHVLVPCVCFSKRLKTITKIDCGMYSYKYAVDKYGTTQDKYGTTHLLISSIF